MMAILLLLTRLPQERGVQQETVHTRETETAGHAIPVHATLNAVSSNERPRAQKPTDLDQVTERHLSQQPLSKLSHSTNGRTLSLERSSRQHVPRVIQDRGGQIAARGTHGARKEFFGGPARGPENQIETDVLHIGSANNICEQYFLYGDQQD
ncbi:hypothetical protein TNCV_2338771 [Trichonephila clavipes]|nr:hypothetical protein TNCV_2338771 [Trichonephila clavipes]